MYGLADIVSLLQTVLYTGPACIRKGKRAAEKRPTATEVMAYDARRVRGRRNQNVRSSNATATQARLIEKKNARAAGRWRAPLATIMKALVAEDFEVVKAGKEFVAPEPLDVPVMVRLMEKNEAYIYWLQRPDADVQAQIAAVKINGLLYGLNMKLEKAIFRHIRLTKNFCNVEVLPDGTRKLRIPQRLFHEKLRTSHRLEVFATSVDCTGADLGFRVYACEHTTPRATLFNTTPAQVMQQSAKQAKGECRSKRKESERVFKRKKRSSYVHYSAAEVADIFRARPDTREPCRLLPSPTSFLRQMARTFHSEFPNFVTGPAFVTAVVGATGSSDTSSESELPQPADRACMS